MVSIGSNTKPIPIFFQEFRHTLTDVLFPIFCFGCEKEGEWLCNDCRAGLLTIGVFRCPICHESSFDGLACVECGSSHIRRVIATLPYHEDALIGRMIRSYKYQYVTALVLEFVTYIERFFQQYPAVLSSVDAVTPIPLHPRRLAERGFNQAHTIAGVVAQHLHVPLQESLERRRYTDHQARLGRKQRQENVSGAFSLMQEEVKNKHILLVDDIYTTGATMQACAQVLREAGAREVSGFALARG